MEERRSSWLSNCLCMYIFVNMSEMNCCKGFFITQYKPDNIKFGCSFFFWLISYFSCPPGHPSATEGECIRPCLSTFCAAAPKPRADVLWNTWVNYHTFVCTLFPTRSPKSAFWGLNSSFWSRESTVPGLKTALSGLKSALSGLHIALSQTRIQLLQA